MGDVRLREHPRTLWTELFSLSLFMICLCPSRVLDNEPHKEHIMNPLGLRGLEPFRSRILWILYRGDDVVFFEVMEINGRYEAVKMLLPSMMETQLGSVTWSNG